MMSCSMISRFIASSAWGEGYTKVLMNYLMFPSSSTGQNLGWEVPLLYLHHVHHHQAFPVCRTSMFSFVNNDLTPVANSLSGVERSEELTNLYGC